jgi:hypothetical protein
MKDDSTKDSSLQVELAKTIPEIKYQMSSLMMHLVKSRFLNDEAKQMLLSRYGRYLNETKEPK